jgi:hypothetical protein
MSWLSEDNWCDSSCGMSWFLEDVKAGVVVWCQLRIRVHLACASSCAYTHTHTHTHTHTLSCSRSCAYTCEELCCAYTFLCALASLSRVHCPLPLASLHLPPSPARAPLHVRPCARSLPPPPPLPVLLRLYPGAQKAHGQADCRGMPCQPLVNPCLMACQPLVNPCLVSSVRAREGG